MIPSLALFALGLAVQDSGAVIVDGRPDMLVIMNAVSDFTTAKGKATMLLSRTDGPSVAVVPAVTISATVVVHGQSRDVDLASAPRAKECDSLPDASVEKSGESLTVTNRGRPIVAVVAERNERNEDRFLEAVVIDKSGRFPLVAGRQLLLIRTGATPVCQRVSLAPPAAPTGEKPQGFSTVFDGFRFFLEGIRVAPKLYSLWSGTLHVDAVHPGSQVAGSDTTFEYTDLKRLEFQPGADVTLELGSIALGVEATIGKFTARMRGTSTTVAGFTEGANSGFAVVETGPGGQNTFDVDVEGDALMIAGHIDLALLDYRVGDWDFGLGLGLKGSYLRLDAQEADPNVFQSFRGLDADEKLWWLEPRISGKAEWRGEKFRIGLLSTVGFPLAGGVRGGVDWQNDLGVTILF